jgi:hypothetical protein
MLSVSDIPQLAASVEGLQRVVRVSLRATTSNEVPACAPEPELDLELLDDAEFEMFTKLVHKCKRSGKGKPPDGDKVP